MTQHGRSIIVTYSNTLLIAIAICCLSVSLATWFVFLRPVPRQTISGAITRKTFKPSSTYWQYPTGNRAGFWTPAQIPIAEGYVFVIEVKGQPADAFYFLNTTAAKAFEVGQRVEIDFEERGIPPIWHRVYVMDMRPVEGP